MDNTFGHYVGASVMKYTENGNSLVNLSIDSRRN